MQTATHPKIESDTRCQPKYPISNLSIHPRADRNQVLGLNPEKDKIFNSRIFCSDSKFGQHQTNQFSKCEMPYFNIQHHHDISDEDESFPLRMEPTPTHS